MPPRRGNFILLILLKNYPQLCENLHIQKAIRSLEDNVAEMFRKQANIQQTSVP